MRRTRLARHRFSLNFLFSSLLDKNGLSIFVTLFLLRAPTIDTRPDTRSLQHARAHPNTTFSGQRIIRSAALGTATCTTRYHRLNQITYSKSAALFISNALASSITVRRAIGIQDLALELTLTATCSVERWYFLAH